MKKFKLTYVDEDKDDIELFQQFIDEKFDLEIITVENNDDLHYIVDEILTTKPDAVVTDFLLSEKARVKFNGQSIIEEIQKRNIHLPCYLLTSHAPDALQATHDARLVQTKSIPFGGNELREHKELFLAQIEKTITNFKSNYESALAEFKELGSLPPEKLTAVDKQRLLELDNFLDSHGFSDNPIPNALKEDRHLELLAKMIESIDKIISDKNE